METLSPSGRFLLFSFKTAEVGVDISLTLSLLDVGLENVAKVVNWTFLGLPSADLTVISGCLSHPDWEGTELSVVI